MRFWYLSKLAWQSWFLLPFVPLVWFISTLKRLKRSKTPYSVPVVVVGNITVGGTGKTPMIIWLAEACRRQNIRIGVVSRGYGAEQTGLFPLLVNDSVTAQQCGDEPKLISTRLGVPVVVDPSRDRAVKHLLSTSEVDVIISDDGLQHYSMYRDLEVLMLDGLRGLGNGQLLPAGPLREVAQRVNSVDFIVSKQYSPDISLKSEVASIAVGVPTNHNGKELDIGEINICSGIGNFESFRESVISLGFNISEQTQLNDHATISSKTLEATELPVVITEKDAIKLDLTDMPHVYVLPINFQLSDEFENKILSRIRELIH